MNKTVIFNPFSTRYNPRMPNSLLSVAASIDGLYDYVMVDGNAENDAWNTINSYFKSGAYNYFAITVMPGVALKQAIPFSKKIKEFYPHVTIIWGGYFASNQYNVVINSGFVDYVVYGPGDKAFPMLLDALVNNKSFNDIPNLIYKNPDGQIIKTHKDELYDQDSLQLFPYDKLNETYPLKKFLPKTYLGKRTLGYHSSMGCPFTCSFCAVVPIYNARWKGKSAATIYKDILYMKEKHGIDAVEFHDNNFFVSEKRTIEFSQLMKQEKMIWWGEGRIDTINKYKDETLALMRESGCKMIFFGAETGNDEVLKKMDKGGTQSGAQIAEFAARMKKFDIIPEYSFVLGTPADTPKQVMKQIDEDIAFIKRIKEINPFTEIIIYVYSPVPTEGSDMYQQVINSGFRFPEKLEDWISPQWENFDLRKNPLTPWLRSEMIDKIKNFETVLNGYFPTNSDIKLSKTQRTFIKLVSSIRYHLGLYQFPYEIKALQKYWLKYRQPEIEGF